MLFLVKFFLCIAGISAGGGFVIGGGIWLNSCSKGDRWQPIIAIIISIGVAIGSFCALMNLFRWH